MNGLLLDTCAAIWLAEGLQMRADARDCIVKAAKTDELFVSPVTAWEIGTLCAAGRFLHAKTHLAAQRWIAVLMARNGIHAAPFTASIALESSNLPELAHRDPADRFLISTARHLAVPLMTRDRVILDYADAGHVQCIPC